jgi:SAM-dependent methyltransferase
MKAAEYLSVTELSGEEISQEQLSRLCSRYGWASTHCIDKDVIEVACGTGPGLGLLQKVSRSLRAGDISDDILMIARKHYHERIHLDVFNAENMPYEDNSADVIILFEAIYYIPNVNQFLQECTRVLRKGGTLLLSTANKDLYDFNPSPFSIAYYGTVELTQMLKKHGFSSHFLGGTPTTRVSFRQKVLRPIKKMVVSLGLMPKSMNGKKLLKRLVFGELVQMPHEIDETTAPMETFTPIPQEVPDHLHKVIYCKATLEN